MMNNIPPQADFVMTDWNVPRLIHLFTAQCHID